MTLLKRLSPGNLVSSRFRIFFPALLFFIVCAYGQAQTTFYWEEPNRFSPGEGRFPVSGFNGDLSVIAWQETSPNSRVITSGESEIHVSIGVKSAGEDWKIYRNVGGPYYYSGEEPAILNVTVDRRNRIIIAAAASVTETEILISSDRGESFSQRRLDSGSESSIAPRLAVRADGGYLLFITRGYDQSLSLYYSRSDDGNTWSPFIPFVRGYGLNLNFLPAHAALGSADYVIFQSFIGGADVIPAFQLYLQTSTDGGLSWSQPRRITDFRDPLMNTGSEPDRFDNQRPHLSVYGNGLFLVWERRFGTGSPQIYSALVNPQGAASGVERVNTEEAYCNNPVGFIYNGTRMAVWFDNRRGDNRIFFGQRDSVAWSNYDLSGSSGDASFGRPVIDGGDLLVLWQIIRGNAGYIYTILPDTTVPPPVLAALNFSPSRRTRGDRARVAWAPPFDTSGIEGYSWLWSRSPREEPPREVLLYPGTNISLSMDLVAEEDGSWYFSVIALDYAGNWSLPSRVEFIRDTTPPSWASIVPPELDENGYLPSNTFSVHWNPPGDPDVAGYTWNLEYLGDADRGEDYETFTVSATGLGTGIVPAGIVETGNQAGYVNQDDGMWRFTVAAVDEVGNVGPTSSVFFRTNKYIPHTYATYVDSAQDEQGLVSIRVIGRGFSAGGNVYRIFLDRDGEAPYDREYTLSNGDFRILSDREITGLRAEDMDEGTYRLGLFHPERGLYVTSPLVTVNRMGTVKFGDFSSVWEPSWLRRETLRVIDPSLLLIAVIFVFCLFGLAASVRGIGNAVAESAAIRVEAAALITGDFMPSEKKKHTVRIRRRGGGLRIKLAFFTIAIVLTVVALVSLPLAYVMTSTQRQTLLRGLWDRSSVLLEGLASSARAYLPANNVLELGFLPAQIAAIPEARYVTITGYNAQASAYGDLVWATNDPEILAKIDTAELQPGISRLTDVLSPRLEQISGELNNRARAEVGSLSQSIGELNQEGLVLASRNDAESRRRFQDIQITTSQLSARFTEGLAAIARDIGSEPSFSTGELPRDGTRTYIFFKPVMYRQGNEDVYFRGLIRLEVTIDSILERIAEDQRTLIRLIFIIAFIALTIGTIGALVLSTLIIRPIRKLVRHVEQIRDTEDKAKLAGVDIRIRSRDEIAVLGNTINDMTHGLVKAALAASDLSIGKEIQKKFIPLEMDREGNKLSSGYKDTKNVSFFGYYEGAKGVSGDYFDYQDLDGRYYAIIKCDVAGKGIPAALIMIQVATMFLNYFKAWKPTAKGMHIEEVVYQINDFIETLGFKGRFAAFTLCLFDSQTGTVRFCNAGDNIIHLFDASEGRIKTLTLPETPATGVLPNFLVESKGGYTVQTMTVDHGDILFLFTDGIEEAKRKFRDGDFREIVCAEGPNDTPHENHVAGQGDEEMGPDRVQAIINAVMNRDVYTLHKWHNPEGNADLSFDFSNCEGKVEEVIMALVSVEKMFRCCKDPGAGEDSRVLVDRKVDAFLKDHFLQYRTYCSYTKENPGNDAYMYYTHVIEDDQYDDLTILGIKRK
ncbi:MAG: SpoIIE family protein phosphatase [Treponema sp.]|jgi:serine phosphatase RsbU (regulator of sigma subunit)|nr:SpoIIE family protein phosphatase [Treponema sp.]